MIGIFLDIESNGLNVMKHRVLEIAFKFMDLGDHKELARYNAIVKQPKDIWEKSDSQSLKVNGFKFEDLSDGKPESTVASEISHLFETFNISRANAVYICQNPSFDRSFFSQLISPEVQEKRLWPYHWLDLASMFWILSIKKWQKKESPAPWDIGISKNKIAAHYNLAEEKTPHKALQGVEHLIECYQKLVLDA